MRFYARPQLALIPASIIVLAVDYERCEGDAGDHNEDASCNSSSAKDFLPGRAAFALFALCLFSLSTFVLARIEPGRLIERYPVHKEARLLLKGQRHGCTPHLSPIQGDGVHTPHDAVVGTNLRAFELKVKARLAFC